MADLSSNETTLLAELRAGRTVTYFTRGVSMRPLLRTAETHVHIRPVRPAGAPVADATADAWVSEIRERDILLYVRASGQLVLHRLIKRDGDRYLIRGDNTYGLEPVRREQIVGVVDLIWRKGRYIDVAVDRRYRRYVTRRILNYPLRCCVHYPAMWARALARRILRRGRRT